MNLPELGAFLRTRRDRIRPAEVGLPQGPRRRVPGLRREEVAQLAGLSADYYTELERGSAKNGVQPSAQTLAALARALRLNGDERDHLFHLAERPVPPSVHGPSAHVQPALLGLLDRLSNTPARVITDLHETLVENDLALALFGNSPAHGGPSASFVYRWFTDPRAREIYPPEDHPHHSRVFVADLQAAAARRGRDAQATKMVAAPPQPGVRGPLGHPRRRGAPHGPQEDRPPSARRHRTRLLQPPQRGRTATPAVVHRPALKSGSRAAGTALCRGDPGAERPGGHGTGEVVCGGIRIAALTRAAGGERPGGRSRTHRPGSRRWRVRPARLRPARRQRAEERVRSLIRRLHDAPPDRSGSLGKATFRLSGTHRGPLRPLAGS